MRMTEKDGKLTLKYFDLKTVLIYTATYIFFIFGSSLAILRTVERPYDELNQPIVLVIIILILAVSIFKLLSLIYGSLRFQLTVHDGKIEVNSSRGFYKFDYKKKEIEFAIRRAFLGYRLYMIDRDLNRKVVKMPFLAWGDAHVIRVKIKLFM